MIARIYSKRNVAMSTYLDFKDKTIEEVKQWFDKNLMNHNDRKKVGYIYSLLDDITYKWEDLLEQK